MNIITEITSDIPDWAAEAMKKGEFWNTALGKIKELEGERDYWRFKCQNEHRAEVTKKGE